MTLCGLTLGDRVGNFPAGAAALESSGIRVFRNRFTTAQNLYKVLDFFAVHFGRVRVRLFKKAADFCPVDQRILVEGVSDELALTVVDELAPLVFKEIQGLGPVVVLQFDLVENPTIVRTVLALEAHVIVFADLSDRDSGTTGRLVEKVLALTEDSLTGGVSSPVALTNEALSDGLESVCLVTTFGEAATNQRVNLLELAHEFLYPPHAFGLQEIFEEGDRFLHILELNLRAFH